MTGHQWQKVIQWQIYVNLRVSYENFSAVCNPHGGEKCLIGSIYHSHHAHSAGDCH